MFTAEVEGSDALRTTWGNVTTAVRVGAWNGVRKGTREGAAESRSQHRYTNRTGELERQTQATPAVWTSDTECTGSIVAKTKYASFVEEGTRAHEIRPRRVGTVSSRRSAGREMPPVLRFQINGRWVSARLVHHPGTKPYAFLALAYVKCEAVMIREIEIGIANAQRILDAA